MKRFIVLLLVSVATLVLVAGCATSPVKRTESMLTKSGFKAVRASTAAQQQEMSSLPPDKISSVKRQGTVYYVFPDPAQNTLYVGNKAQYQAFKQALSDLQLEQDAKMERNFQISRVTNEDIGAMSGAMPSFEQIWEGWPTGE
jgi:hypothetical protein